MLGRWLTRSASNCVVARWSRNFRWRAWKFIGLSLTVLGSQFSVENCESTSPTSHRAGELSEGQFRARGQVKIPMSRKSGETWGNPSVAALSCRSSVSTYSPSQVTLLFQSTNEPCGLPRQAQTWSSKKEGMLKRFGAATKLKTCPSSTGGVLLLAASQLAESRMNSTPTSTILPLNGS